MVLITLSSAQQVGTVGALMRMEEKSRDPEEEGGLTVSQQVKLGFLQPVYHTTS